MLCSGHIKNIFDVAKNKKNVVCFTCKNNKEFVDKKCIVLDVKENQLVDNTRLDAKLYLKDITTPEENMVEIFVKDIDRFIVTNDIYN